MVEKIIPWFLHVEEGVSFGIECYATGTKSVWQVSVETMLAVLSKDGVILSRIDVVKTKGE